MPNDHGISDDDPLEVAQWTDEGRVRLRAAADELVSVVRQHVDTLAAATGTRDTMSLFSVNHRLLEASRAYAAAQLDLTGTAYPFGALPPLNDEEASDAHEAEKPVPGSGVTVLQRRDFVVTDEAAVLAAGRAAYDRVWSPDQPEEAAAQVTDVATALYEIGHSDGWDALEQLSGLDLTASVGDVIRHDSVLTGNPDEWPDSPYVISDQNRRPT